MDSSKYISMYTIHIFLPLLSYYRYNSVYHILEKLQGAIYTKSREVHCLGDFPALCYLTFLVSDRGAGVGVGGWLRNTSTNSFISISHQFTCF